MLVARPLQAADLVEAREGHAGEGRGRLLTVPGDPVGEGLLERVEVAVAQGVEQFGCGTGVHRGLTFSHAGRTLWRLRLPTTSVLREILRLS